MNANRLINMAIRYGMRFFMRKMSKGKPVDPNVAKATKAMQTARRVGKF
ncbi:MAG: hypothetical protein HKN27_10365 [Silicimonas sp.]|nr:hypothetical protein [Silicimonas sp.]